MVLYGVTMEPSVEQKEVLGPKGKILVVDDEEFVGDILAEHLQENEYEAVFCDNPQDALKKVQEDQWDGVITDLDMLPINGTKLIEEIRKVYPNIRTWVVSGRFSDLAPDKLEEKARELEVDKVFGKPYKMGEMLQSVNEMMQEIGQILMK